MFNSRVTLLTVVIGGALVIAGCKKEGKRKTGPAATPPSATMPSEMTPAIPPTTQEGVAPTTQGAAPYGSTATEPSR